MDIIIVVIIIDTMIIIVVVIMTIISDAIQVVLHLCCSSYRSLQLYDVPPAAVIVMTATDQRPQVPQC